MSTAPVAGEPNFGLIIRERKPLNLEYPFDQLDEFLTPNDLFYIRRHFKAPVLDRHDYNLAIYGAVKTPFKISYEELLTMPSVTQPATLESVGNGRIFLIPQVKGAQWQLGAVSTANCTGVPLSALLERAGVNADACENLFEACDTGTPKEEPIPPGDTNIYFARRNHYRYHRSGDPKRHPNRNGCKQGDDTDRHKQWCWQLHCRSADSRCLRGEG